MILLKIYNSIYTRKMLAPEKQLIKQVGIKKEKVLLDNAKGIIHLM
jgi:hypothetical protein